MRISLLQIIYNLDPCLHRLFKSDQIYNLVEGLVLKFKGKGQFEFDCCEVIIITNLVLLRVPTHLPEAALELAAYSGDIVLKAEFRYILVLCPWLLLKKTAHQRKQVPLQLTSKYFIKCFSD